jgi:hypothetical protein
VKIISAEAPCLFTKAAEIFISELMLHQGHTARGIHGLPKVLCSAAMPNPFMPCGRATPLTAIWGVARPQGGQAAAVFFPLGYPTSYGPVLHAWIHTEDNMRRTLQVSYMIRGTMLKVLLINSN